MKLAGANEGRPAKFSEISHRRNGGRRTPPQREERVHQMLLVAILSELTFSVSAHVHEFQKKVIVTTGGSGCNHCTCISKSI